ncbi:CP4B1-like protein [Mya arenaria]|uniref:CP4B1-like protein n=1 Tax=Mya arenaria TaxID=6604 RepID=A0ABY7E410_MYAAR|nr:CP4B1-like protein [Mya arenaria]
MLVYVLIIVLCWALWKTIVFLWRRQQQKQLFNDIPLVFDHHWFWGLAKKASNVHDAVEIQKRFVAEVRPKWYCSWLLLIEPALFPSSPDVFREVYSAIDVPKRHGWSGPYRMFAAWVGDGLLTSNGKKWERNRRLLTPAFHFDILKSYVVVYNKVVDIFMDRVGEACADGRSVDVYPYVSRATLDTMLRCGMSYMDDGIQNNKDQHPYVVAIHRLGTLLMERVLNPVHYLDFIYYHTAKGKEFRKLSTSRRSKDFLDILITARDDSGAGLTETEIMDEVSTFLFAGHDTTASAIGWSLYALGMYPDIQGKVREEFQYTTCFIKEVLRYYCPVPAQSRVLAHPLTVQGKTFRPGQIIDIGMNSLHHNPAVWGEDHNEFQPERFFSKNSLHRDPFAFLPFAAGQRNCIGQNFAMNEIKAFLSVVVRRFTISTDPDRPAVPYAEVTTRAKDGIYLHFQHRRKY